jgi:membrane protease YdiL (CAAX protease family)
MSRPGGSVPRTIAWGALAGWLVIAAVQIAVAFASRSSESRDSEGTVLYSWSFAVGSIVIYSVLVGFTFLIATGLGEPRRALGLVPFERRWLGRAALVVVASAVLGRILEPVLHGGEKQGYAPDAWEPRHAAAFAVNSLVTVTIVPFAEELFFRGAGVSVLRGFGPTVAIAGTAVVFGLAHGILVALPVLVALAAGLAWIRLRSGSVWPSITAHAGYNGLAILVLYLTLQ